MAIAHAAIRLKRSNDSRGTDSSIPPSAQRDMYFKLTANNKEMENKTRADLSYTKRKGESYLRINCKKVKPMNGIYKSYWPYSKDGLINVSIRDGEIEHIEFDTNRITLDKLHDKLKNIKETEAEINRKEAQLSTMSEKEIQDLVVDKFRNTIGKEFVFIPTEFWQSIDPVLIEKRRVVAEKILTKLKYSQMPPGTTLLAGVNYYRVCSNAINGICTVRKDYEWNDNVITQTYVDGKGVPCGPEPIVVNDGIWTRNMLVAKVYPSASDAYKNYPNDIVPDPVNIRMGGKNRKTRKTRKRSPK